MKLKIVMGVLIVALLACLGLLGKVAWDKRQLSTANAQLNEQLMQANDKLGRALTRFGDAEEYIGELETDIQKEISERQAVVTMYGKLQLKYDKLEKDKKITNVTTVFVDREIPVPIELGLEQGMFYEAVTTALLRPVGSISGQYKDYRLEMKTEFKPRSTSNGGALWDLSYQLHLKFDVQFVETHLPDGGVNHYATAWELDENGKRGDKLDISNFEVVVQQPEQKQMFWWAPHIDIGVLGGAKFMPLDYIVGGSVGFSPFGYGLTVNDLDWRMLRVSVDFTNNGIPGLGCTPVMYNLGQPIYLLSNLWVGPHINYLPPQGWGVGLFIGAVL